MSGTLRALRLDSVRKTIFVFAVLATLIPALATAWISYRQNRRAIVDKLTQQLQSTSAQAAREADLWLKERLYDLRVFGTSYEVTDILERGGAAGRRSPARLGEYLRSVKERFTDYDELMVLDPGRRIVASSASRSEGLHLSSEWISHVRAGDPALGEPYRTGPDSAVRMELAVPLQAASGRFLGALAARVNFNGLDPALRALLTRSTDRVTIIDREGRVIVRIAGEDSSGGVARVLNPGTLIRLREAGADPESYVDAGGVPVLGILAEITRPGWAAVAAIPREAAFADIAQLRNTTALLVAVLLVVVGALAYGLGLLIVRPLGRLSRAAARVAAGDLEAEVPVAGGGELAYLAEVFNEMVRRLKQARSELERLSMTDGLTGLLNRRALMSELEREIRREDRHDRKFSVLMLDVDHFKKFNDSHGHLSGDDVLRRVAKVVQDAIREVDIAARYGGEEYFVVLPETEAAAAAVVAERIRDRVAKERFLTGNGPAVSVTVSIGVAQCPTHGDSAEKLIDAADVALYKAKKEGRNRVVMVTA